MGRASGLAQSGGTQLRGASASPMTRGAGAVARKPLIDKSVEVFDEDGVQQVFAISPFGASETRQERLARWQVLGTYDPDCTYCNEMRDHPTLSAFMPSHKASPRCRSGGRPHCTCDTCF